MLFVKRDLENVLETLGTGTTFYTRISFHYESARSRRHRQIGVFKVLPTYSEVPMQVEHENKGSYWIVAR
jgi:hypothetical protein